MPESPLPWVSDPSHQHHQRLSRALVPHLRPAPSSVLSSYSAAATSFSLTHQLQDFGRVVGQKSLEQEISAWRALAAPTDLREGSLKDNTPDAVV